jgi:hypothetical protein
LAQHYSVAPHTAAICEVFINGMCEVVVDGGPEFEDESSFCAACGVAFGQLVAATSDRASITGHTLSIVQELVRCPGWECAYAALKALRRLMPHCCDIVSGWMDDIIRCLGLHFTHPHWFVRHEAFLAIARYLQLSDFALRYYGPVLDAVMALLDRGDAEIVVIAALVTLAVICRNLPNEIMGPLAAPIATRMMRDFASSPAGVQAQTVRVLSSLSFSCPVGMHPFYPVLIQLLRAVHAGPDSVLLCRAVEAVAIVATVDSSDVAPHDLAFFLDAWMAWDWAVLGHDTNQQLIQSLSSLIARFPGLLADYTDALVRKMSFLVAFEPDCVKYGPYSQDIAFSHDCLVFASGQGTYVEYYISDLQRVQFTLELLGQVIGLAGPARAPLFSPFTKRLRTFLRWNFFPKVQIAALRCLADLAAGSGVEDFLPRLLLAIVRCLDTGAQLSPIAQRAFLAILRDLLRLGITLGRFSAQDVPGFLSAVPDIRGLIWAPREGIIVDEQPSPSAVEEELALTVVLICDCFPDQISIVPIPEIPEFPRSSQSPYFMLVCAKFVNVTHSIAPEWENALLLAVSNALCDDDSAIVRVGCAALMLIVGSITLDPEFINEILSCARMALRKHEHVRRTADAVVVVLAALMHLFPEQGTKPENVAIWLAALPVSTRLPGIELVWQWLLAVMNAPDLLEMGGETVLRIAQILASVAATDLIDRGIELELRTCLGVIAQNPLIAEFLQSQDETVQRKFAALVHPES